MNDKITIGGITHSEAEWSMPACPCTGLTIRQATQAIADGARSTEEVFERCNEIVYCSQCMVTIDDMVFAALRRQREQEAEQAKREQTGG